MLDMIPQTRATILDSLYRLDVLFFFFLPRIPPAVSMPGRSRASTGTIGMGLILYMRFKRRLVLFGGYGANVTPAGRRVVIPAGTDMSPLDLRRVCVLRTCYSVCARGSRTLSPLK